MIAVFDTESGRMLECRGGSQVPDFSAVRTTPFPEQPRLALQEVMSAGEPVRGLPPDLALTDPEQFLARWQGSGSPGASGAGRFLE
jgi:hypothetical protein